MPDCPKSREVAQTKTHGQTGGRGGKPSGTYKSWSGMIQRCTNVNREKYTNYGGRGITICERWSLFENFYADMGDRPLGMSLDRKDVNDNYTPTNCRWSTSQEQSRNKRSTVVTSDSVQEIVGRFEHGEKQVSIARRFGLKGSYVTNIIRGSVWPEVARPYLVGWKRRESALTGARAEAAKSRAILLAKLKIVSTYQHVAGSRETPNLIGHRFGLLIVLYRAPNDSHGNVRWRVSCSCPRAVEKIVLSRNLVHGKTTSCGCRMTRLTHGQSGGVMRRASGAYVSWSQMIQRCTNPNYRHYLHYGGRGIQVDVRWMRFENFYMDMGDRPAETSLERKDVNGNYESGNCRWASLQEQARNRRSTIVTFDRVQEIIGRFEHGESKTSIGRRLGIAPTYIGTIINGKTWLEVDRPYLSKGQL